MHFAFETMYSLKLERCAHDEDLLRMFVEQSYSKIYPSSALTMLVVKLANTEVATTKGR